MYFGVRDAPGCWFVAAGQVRRIRSVAYEVDYDPSRWKKSAEVMMDAESRRKQTRA